MRPVSEQVMVVVGASSGIGRLTALLAAQRGARVVLAARNRSDLERAVEEIRRDGGEALAVPTDVTDPAQVEALAGRAVAEYGRIDSWVTTAAVSLYGTFRQVPLEEFRRVMEVNFMGQVHCARAALPHLERTAGALVCVGSALSDRGIPLQGAYCASKHALKGWLESLRVELWKEGSPVRLTLVKPSSINTPLFNKAKTYLGVQPQPIPPVYDPRLAAEVILRAAEETVRDAYVGGAGKAFAVAERLSPKLLDVHQRVAGFDSQRTGWPKEPEAPHNLYAPVAHDGGVRGDFLAREKERRVYHDVAAHPVAAPLAAAAHLAVGMLALRGRRRGGALPALLGAGALLLAGKGTLSATVEA
jgi:NAD(P)-dependent dehydrogenase (short-subunit alcohol dehydrogenase family)